MVKGDLTPGKTLCICDQCGDEFWKRTADVRANLRRGMGQFCSRSHSVIYGNKHPSDSKNKASARTAASNRVARTDRIAKEGLSPFRFFHKVIRNRRRPNGDHREVTVSLLDLRDQWDKQNGICPYTGVAMILPGTQGFGSSNVCVDRASLDRIDSSKGYIPGNIQFVSQMANYAKSTASHDEMVRFCQAIAEHWRSA